VIPIALAALLGLAAFPLALVFGPAYFPWSLLVFASFGGVVGLSVMPRGPRSRFLHGLSLAALMVFVVLVALTVTSNVALRPDAWTADPGVLAAALVWAGWLFLPVLIGVFVGAWLRGRMGIARGAGVGAASVLAVALVGAGLAFAVAAPEVAGAPICDGGFECPRTWCRYMAERSRVMAIERVTAYDGEHITCTYTAWGGIYIGRADVSRNGGSWTDGAWPEIVSGRRG
jgi:hypothetical protein